MSIVVREITDDVCVLRVPVNIETNTLAPGRAIDVCMGGVRIGLVSVTMGGALWGPAPWIITTLALNDLFPPVVLLPTTTHDIVRAVMVPLEPGARMRGRISGARVALVREPAGREPTVFVMDAPPAYNFCVVVGPGTTDVKDFRFRPVVPRLNYAVNAWDMDEIIALARAMLFPSTDDVVIHRDDMPVVSKSV